MRLLTRRTGYVALGLLLVFVVLLVPLPVWSSRIGNELENAGHWPLFALVGWGALCWLQSRQREDPPPPGSPAAHPAMPYLNALLLAAVLAGVTELVQPITGRDDDWHDFYTDILGAVSALAVLAAFNTARRPWLRLLLVATALTATALAIWPVPYALAAYQHRNQMAPRLLDPDSALGRYFLQRRAVRIAAAPQGGWQVTTSQSLWPGLTVDEVIPDWSGYRSLLVDVANPDAVPFTLLLRIDDSGPAHRYADRYNSSYTIPAGTRVAWRVPLQSLRRRSGGRELDLTHIRRVILYQDSATPAQHYVLYDLRLER